MSNLKNFLAIATVCLLFSAIEIPGLDFTLPVDPGKVRRVHKSPIIRIPHTTTVARRPSWSLDFPMETGEQVGAVEQGEVVTSEYHKYKGNWVSIRHNDSITSEYWHLSELKVQEGQLLNKGQLIGLVGNTGLSTVPHLALYMKSNGKLLWPCALLPCELLP